MGADNMLDLDGLLRQASKYRVIIVLAFAVVVLAASTCYFYGQSSDRAAALSRKGAEYDSLSAQFSNLSRDHTALVASNKNLSEQFDNLSYRYDDLYSNASTVISDYERLSGMVGRFQEKSGAVLALTYKVRRADTAEGQRVFVDATVYNVGNSKADSFTIKCKVIFDNQPNIDEHLVTDLQPLDKRTITWNYSSFADIDALWI